MNKGEVKGIRVFDVFFPSKTNLMRVLGYKFCPSFKDEKEIEEWLMKRFNLDDRAYLTELSNHRRSTRLWQPCRVRAMRC